MNDKLDIDKAAGHLSNFLSSSIMEMKLAVQALGKSAFNTLDRSDLVCVDKELADFSGVRYAGSRRQSLLNDAYVTWQRDGADVYGGELRQH